jgi:hypothetical protein
MTQDVALALFVGLGALANLLALALTAVYESFTLSIASTREKVRRRATFEEIHERPTAAELLAAWEPLLHAMRSRGIKPQALPFVALFRAEPDQIADRNRLKALVHKYVTVVNDELCARMDSGLIAPRDLVRLHADLHETLLNELPLVAPVIWFRSLGKEKAGRWGYRVLLLQDVLQNLKGLSSRRQVHGIKPPESEGASFSAYSAPVQLHRIRRRKNIDRTEKIRQNRDSMQMREFLNALSLEVPDPEKVANELRDKARQW